MRSINTSPGPEHVPETVYLEKIKKNKNFRFGLGGSASQISRVLAEGAKPPQTPPLKRSFVTFDRGGQTGPPRSNYFFRRRCDCHTCMCRPNVQPDDRPPGVRPDERPSGRPCNVTLGRTSGRTPAETFNLRYTPIRGIRTGRGDQPSAYTKNSPCAEHQVINLRFC